jgi:hypothetical protein
MVGEKVFVVLEETGSAADCCNCTGVLQAAEAEYHVYMMIPSVPVPPTVIVAVNVMEPFTQMTLVTGMEVTDTPVGHIVA